MKKSLSFIFLILSNISCYGWHTITFDNDRKEEVSIEYKDPTTYETKRTKLKPHTAYRLCSKSYRDWQKQTKMLGTSHNDINIKNKAKILFATKVKDKNCDYTIKIKKSAEDKSTIKFSDVINYKALPKGVKLISPSLCTK